MKKTAIAALALMVPLAMTSAKADVITNYEVSASMNIYLASVGNDLYNVAGSFAYDATTNSIGTWNFEFATTGFAFALGTNDSSPSAQPAFADANPALTSFQFWEGSATSYPNSRSFTFNVADPLFTGSEPIESASYYGVNETIGNTFHSGTLTATTTGVPEPSTMMLLAFGVVTMFGLRSRKTFDRRIS